jgi:acyl-CoA thioester hydrolase
MISHRSSVRVRYRDTDQMGVVYHSVYLEFFETARTELLRAHGMPYASIEAKGLMLPVLEASLQIKGGARYDDVIDIESSIAPMEGVRMRITYRLLRGDELLVSGHTVHAFVTADAMRPARPPKDFLALLTSS